MLGGGCSIFPSVYSCQTVMIRTASQKEPFAPPPSLAKFPTSARAQPTRLLLNEEDGYQGHL